MSLEFIMDNGGPRLQFAGAGHVTSEDQPGLDFSVDSGAEIARQAPVSGSLGAHQLNAGGPYGNVQPVIDAEGIAVARMLEAARGCPNWASAVRAVHYALRRIEEDKGLGYGKCP